jgi:hypothetical protein
VNVKGLGLPQRLDLPGFSTRIDWQGFFAGLLNGTFSMGILAALVIGAIAGRPA